MKKIFCIVLLSSAFSFLKAQSITDTATYLKDSIIQKKSYYIGKPFSVLLKDLAIGVVDNIDNNSILGTTDTFYTKRIRVIFYPIEGLIDRVNAQRMTPTIVITFQDTLAIPRHYFSRGCLLDYYKGWTRNKRNYWGQFIVADIRLSGVK